MQKKLLLKIVLAGSVISAGTGIYAAAERQEHKELFAAINRNDGMQVDEIINNKAFDLGKQRNNRGMTPLMVAAQQGALDALNALINQKVNIEAKAWPLCESNEYKKDQGKTALVYAAEKGHVAIVESLLQAGAQIESGSIELDDYVSALIGAAFYEHIDVIKTLVKTSEQTGAKNRIINAQNKAGYTALMVAAQLTASQEIIEFLLANGANETVRNKAGQTAFDIAKNQTKDEAKYIKSNQAVLDLLRG